MGTSAIPIGRRDAGWLKVAARMRALFLRDNIRRGYKPSFPSGRVNNLDVGCRNNTYELHQAARFSFRRGWRFDPTIRDLGMGSGFAQDIRAKITFESEKLVSVRYPVHPASVNDFGRGRHVCM